MRTRYKDIPTFITRDQSLIRELMHPQHHACRNQSLAEAVIAPQQKTTRHRHRQTEELYYVAQGQGLMTLGDDQFVVQSGDTICIRPGTVHCIENTGSENLHILCCCSPAYSDSDTELLE